MVAPPRARIGDQGLSIKGIAGPWHNGIRRVRAGLPDRPRSGPPIEGASAQRSSRPREGRGTYPTLAPEDSHGGGRHVTIRIVAGPLLVLRVPAAIVRPRLLSLIPPRKAPRLIFASATAASTSASVLPIQNRPAGICTTSAPSMSRISREPSWRPSRPQTRLVERWPGGRNPASKRAAPRRTAGRRTGLHWRNGDLLG
jgi:hypothetical protein